LTKIFLKKYEKISIIAMKSGDKKSGALFQTLKSQIKSIKILKINGFFILLKLILGNSDFFC
jgi:hypothetical protein